MRNSGWEIVWEPTGASPRMLLDFGDPMETEITLPVEGASFIGRSDFAASAVPVSRGNARRRLGFSRRLKHGSGPESWARCSEEIAALPWGTRGIVSLRPLGGLQRYFHAAVADSSHEPGTGFTQPESVHGYSLRVAPLSAMILPDGTVVTGGYFVSGGYHVPQLPPGVSIPADTKVIITGTPGVIPGNYTVGGGGVPPGGGGIDVPVEHDDDPASTPTVTSAPVIAGDPVSGGDLTATPGTWSNATAVTRRWFFNGSATGATGTAYTIPETAEEGDTVALLETAINGDVVRQAWSNTLVVTEEIPVNVTPPVISGLNTVGSLLAVTPGTWEGASVVTRQWLRNGVLTGGTGLSFVIPPEAEDGDDILCRETAANGNGSAQADSNVIEVAAAPKNTVPPVIAGDAEPDGVLTATPGTWTAAESVTGEWFFNGAATGDTDLTWAFPTMAVDGDYAFYKETATNDTGAAEEFSNILTIEPPFDDSPVVIPAADLWVALSGGTWRGTRQIGLTLEWLGLPAGTTVEIWSEGPIPADGDGSTPAETGFSFQVNVDPVGSPQEDDLDIFGADLHGKDYYADAPTTHEDYPDLNGRAVQYVRNGCNSILIRVRDSEATLLAQFFVTPFVGTTCRMRNTAPALADQESGRAMRIIMGESGPELVVPVGFLVT